MVLFRFLWFPSLIFITVLACWRLDRAFGWRGLQVPWLGAVLVLAGTLLVAWCWGLFAWIGEGTPSRGGRRRKVYRILPEGARVLREWYTGIRTIASGVVARLDRMAEEAN